MTAIPLSTEQPASIDTIDLTDPSLFSHDRHESIFERLRDEDPVHWQSQSESGPFWNLTRYEDVKNADIDHHLFSSRDISIVEDIPEGFDISMFMAMDPPRHTVYRNALHKLFSPANMTVMENGLRAHTIAVLDALPVGESIDWVEQVSVEITSHVLATLFKFPIERRKELIEWSDAAVLRNSRENGASVTWEARQDRLMECFHEFYGSIRSRDPEDDIDLVSVLANRHGQKHLKPSEFFGNILLLIVAGNDTTRNSITGGVVALNRFPDQYDLLRDDPGLVLPTAIPEMFRWQSPVAYMRRTAACDTRLHGRHIREGEKVLLWYASGNRDDRFFKDPHAFAAGRRNAIKSLAFGFGVHRCPGQLLASMQLRVLWEEVMNRFECVEMVGEPDYLPSTFLKGYSKLNVVLHPWPAGTRRRSGNLEGTING
jgi:cytochrome P450